MDTIKQMVGQLAIFTTIILCWYLFLSLSLLALLGFVSTLSGSLGIASDAIPLALIIPIIPAIATMPIVLGRLSIRRIYG